VAVWHSHVTVLCQLSQAVLEFLQVHHALASYSGRSTAVYSQYSEERATRWNSNEDDGGGRGTIPRYRGINSRSPFT
jgi:hypothetical protein